MDFFPQEKGVVFIFVFYKMIGQEVVLPLKNSFRLF